MRIFKNKFLFKLIASICVFLALFNFAISISNRVYAVNWGGLLLTPIVDLLTAIGDSVMEILHKSVQEQQAAIIRVDEETQVSSFLKTVLSVAVGILAGIALIGILSVAGLGATAMVGLLIGQTITFTISTGVVVAGIATAVFVGYKANHDWFRQGVIYLPMFSVTAEEIFSNRLLLFDVNFFDPKPPEEVVTTQVQIVDQTFEEKDIFTQTTNSQNVEEESWINLGDELENMPENTGAGPGRDGGGTTSQFYVNGIENYPAIKFVFDTINQANTNKIDFSYGIDYGIGYIINSRTDYSKSYTIQIQYEATVLHEIEFSWEENREMGTYTATISIHQNEFMLPEREVATTDTTMIHSTAARLQGIVSSWYFALRNIALLVLMLVLLYSGIRIVISSTAGEKAKYKERIMDWLVALCLVMVMHYIMVFAVEFVEKITELVAAGVGTHGNAFDVPLSEKQYKKLANTSDNYEDNLNLDLTEIGASLYSNETEMGVLWPTDLAGAFRIQLQYENEGTGKWFGYSICYVVLILFTLFFAFTYAKRLVYMAFLTIIAPLVAMTYPIDKITDGKAQAFDAWLKEYIFNLLIQPLHLLLYTVLVSSAYTLASSSPVYALVAVGFMLPAERLLRRFFGFEKAKTPGLLGGAAGAALVMSGLKGIMGHKPPNKNESGSGSGSKGDNGEVKYSRSGLSSSEAMTAIAGEASSDDNQATIRTNSSQEGAGSDNQGNGSSEEDEPQELDYQGYGNPVGGNSSRTNNNNNSEDEEDDLDYQGYGNTVGQRANNPAPEEELFETNTTPPVNLTHHTLRNMSPDELKKRRKARRRAIIGGVSKKVAGKAFKNIHPTRALGRLMSAAAFGTVGLIAGVASGDVSKTAQYAGIGLAGGNNLAKSLSRSKTSLGDDFKEIRESAQIAYYGEEYKDIVLKKEKERLKKSEEYISYLRKTMGVSRKDAKEILNTTGDKCLDKGVSNIEDIATIHRMTQGENAISMDKALAARKYSKRMPGDPSQMTQEEVNERIARYTNEFEQAGYGNAAGLGKEAFDLAAKFKKTQSDLTKI